MYELAQSTKRKEIASAIGFCLQKLEGQTQEDTSGTSAIFETGVCQGSPLNSMMFSIYMDTPPHFVQLAAPTTPQIKKQSRQS